MFFILFIVGGSAMMDMITAMAKPENANNPATMFPMLADMMDHLLPATTAMTVIYIPFMWFMTLLLGIAFQRFRGRRAD
jgi:hypothetical protein